MDKTELIKMMLEQDGKNAPAWYLLGLEYCEMHENGRALHAFSEALKYGDEDMKIKVAAELERLAAQNFQPARDDGGAEEPPANEERAPDAEEAVDGPPVGERGTLLKIVDCRRQNAGYVSPPENKPDAVTFRDVGGLDELKATISMKIIEPFRNPALFSRFKKKIGGGILLYGPPGCGKTFIAKATAGECSARFIPVRITDILDPYIGVSERNVEAIFANARAKRPCIMFFDEIDTLGYNRSKVSTGNLRSVVDQMLTEIEGIDSSMDQMLVIGATNMPWDVDPALKRPGRFDKTIFVPPPDESARAAIFRFKLSGKPVEAIDYALLAKRTELYSGADIENIVEIAAETVIVSIMSSGEDRQISMTDLLDAIDHTRPSTIEWLKTIKNYVKYSNQAGFYNDVDMFLSNHKKLLG